MEQQAIRRKFQEIGSDIIFSENKWIREDALRINVKEKKGREIFTLEHHPKFEGKINILQTDASDRHLLLFGKVPVKNERGQVIDFAKFRTLCGHDERHFFSADIRDAVSTIVEAKKSLMPDEFIKTHKKKGRTKNLLKRNNETGKRQGEWLFKKTNLQPPEDAYILKNEPISRGRGSKPHICQEVYRTGGRTVYVNDQFAPNGISAKQKNILQKQHPHAPFRTMKADANVYARGTVRHPDHRTIKLIGWHKVLMNNEGTGVSVFLD